MCLHWILQLLQAQKLLGQRGLSSLHEKREANKKEDKRMGKKEY